jgi:hypothetical protein
MIFYELYEINDLGKRHTICEVIEYNDDGYCRGDGHVDVYQEDLKDMGIFIKTIVNKITYSNLDEFKKNHLNKNRKLYRYP